MEGSDIPFLAARHGLPSGDAPFVDALSGGSAARDAEVPQIKTEVQVFSSSLGAMGSLLGKLRSLLHFPEILLLPELLKPQTHKLELLKQDLEATNAFLVNLSLVEAPNMMVKHWMNEVRDLSYDIEDYIDKMMRPDRKTSEVSCSDEVEELSTLVKQVNDAHERHKRYDLGRLASNPRYVVDDGQGLNGEPTYLVGIDDSKAELIKRLNIDGEGRLVVSIQGPAGVGKTTLAKEVYRAIGGQFDCRAFVRGSRTPDTRMLLLSIISQVQCHHQGPPHGLPVQELIDSLRKLLQHKSYFIVIDGLWETTSWDIVTGAFPEDTHCNRILITTDIEEVALECCDYEYDAIFKMEPLSGNYPTELFFNRVFGIKHECSREMRKKSEEIIRICGGLPLAIISIASIFASQPDDSDLWRHVKEVLFSRLRYNHPLEGMLKEIVVLSYNSLPHHLQSCLLYLSMYPEGYTFLKADMVKQWSAEGFIIAVEEKNCDQVAEDYLDELVYKGLIQPNDINISDEVILYAVHSTVFEVIRNMSIEENFTTVIDYSSTILELTAKVRRLSLRFSVAKYATKPEDITLSPVRSLMFYGLVECLPSIMEFEVLRVLILEFWGDQKELDLSGIDRLFLLRYLRITTNIMVQLPARMIRLAHLQTMEIYASVSSVPSDIIHLPRLLHLCLHGEINLSSGIGHLTSLSTLQYFDLSTNSEVSVRKIGEMKALNNLHVTSSEETSDSLKRNLIALVSSIGKLRNLKSLILAPAPSCTSIYLDCSWSIFFLSVFLQRLELLPPICIFPRLPVWIGQLQKLCILKIVLRELTTGHVDSIARLQELTILSLYIRQPTGELIVFHHAAFPAVKCFKFRCGVMRLSFQADAMPRLQNLKLEFNAHSGKQNGNMLAGIEHLLNLKEISCRVGAAPGSVESDKMAAESLLKDAISKHSRLISFNLRIVHLFNEEISTFGDTPASCSGSDEEHNRLSMANAMRELSEAEAVREVSPFRDANPEIHQTQRGGARGGEGGREGTRRMRLSGDARADVKLYRGVRRLFTGRYAAEIREPAKKARVWLGTLTPPKKRRARMTPLPGTSAAPKRGPTSPASPRHPRRTKCLVLRQSRCPRLRRHPVPPTGRRQLVLDRLIPAATTLISTRDGGMTDGEGMPKAANPALSGPRVVDQTQAISQVKTLDDGRRWREYGLVYYSHEASSSVLGPEAKEADNSEDSGSESSVNSSVSGTASADNSEDSGIESAGDPNP